MRCLYDEDAAGGHSPKLGESGAHGIYGKWEDKNSNLETIPSTTLTKV